MDEDEQTALEYLNRAEEVRTIAGNMEDQKTRQILLDVAKGYERMAETMRRIAKADLDGNS